MVLIEETSPILLKMVVLKSRMQRDVIFHPDSIEFEGELMSVFYLFALEFFRGGGGCANVRRCSSLRV